MQKFTPSDIREMIDLYCWGARTDDICLLYNISLRHLKKLLDKSNTPRRANGRPKNREGYVRSSRRPKPLAALYDCLDPSQDVDRQVLSSVRASLERRTGEHQ